MDERRTSIRRRSLKGARIVFNGGYSTLSCLIRNFSDTGAKLEFESVIGIPNQFSLHYADGSPPRQCVVRWKTGTTLGVEFEEDDRRGA